MLNALSVTENLILQKNSCFDDFTLFGKSRFLKMQFLEVWMMLTQIALLILLE